MFLALLLACGTPSPAEGCAALSVADCASDTACRVIDGTAVEWATDGSCYTMGADEDLACADADQTCDEAITYAGPGDGTCYEFNNSCTPKGWTSCDPSPYDSVMCDG
jgi:hypothetical protein